LAASNLVCRVTYLGEISAASAANKIRDLGTIKGVKMMFSFFLSIYSWCGTSASWAAQHPTMCLDTYVIPRIIYQGMKPN